MEIAGGYEEKACRMQVKTLFCNKVMSTPYDFYGKSNPDIACKLVLITVVWPNNQVRGGFSG
jgi:hypothetical protein